MSSSLWQITISHSDYCPDSQTFEIATHQLSEMTRNPEFSEMIDGSSVLGGLIGVLDSTHD